MRRLSEEATDDTYVTASAKGEDEQLTDDQKNWIIDYYTSRIPIYGSLLEEYKKAKAKKRCSRAQFPPIEHWQPSGRKINLFEQMLLSGPTLTLNSIKRVRIKMPKTKKWIVYAPESDENSLRISSSYVCADINNGQPQFGRIIKLYTHTFGGCNSVICKINLTKLQHMILN